jgi:hypothetical protein
MTMDTETERELYGVNPWVVGEILSIITLIVPLGVVPVQGELVFYASWFSGPFVYGLLWMLELGYRPYLFSLHFLDLTYMWTLVPLSIFSILYIRQIVRYYLGKSSRDSAIMAGLLSIIFPSLVALLSVILWSDISRAGFIVPIPIQFLIGLYFLHRFEGPEVISPWAGQFIDWSWWSRLRRRKPNRVAHIIEMHVEEEQENID